MESFQIPPKKLGRMMNLPPKIVEGSSFSMDQAFIPSEIIINILSRLPVKSVIRCKCVCKSWLELLETPEFAKDHLSRSVPGLIAYHDIFKVFEFVNELELEHHGLHYELVIEFKKKIFASTRPRDAVGIEGSVNGLVLLWGNYQPNALYVCNPISREYIELPCLYLDPNSKLVTQGFGVSLTSGQYKVVRILREYTPNEYIESLGVLRSKCWVYTLGTRSWRCITPCHYYNYDGATRAFLNGNLHWLVVDKNGSGSDLISCFDLETEVFSTFSAPPPLGISSYQSDLVIFEDCLCICENTSGPDNIVMWVLKEYRNKNSWTKQFVFTKDPDLASRPFQRIYPLKLFEDGDILLLRKSLFLFYYSKKTNTAQKLDLFELREYGFIEAQLHVSSFLSLTSFAMEAVRKF